MKQVWTADELGESWTLTHEEFVLVENHRGVANRLGFALQLQLQLQHYQLCARFLDSYRQVARDGSCSEEHCHEVGDGTYPRKEKG